MRGEGAPRSPEIRATSLFRNGPWLALAPFGALAFALAFYGFRVCDAATTPSCAASSDLDRIVRSLDLVRGRGSFTFNKDPLALVLAQWLLPLAAVLTAAKLFLIGLRRDIRVALARRARDHVIVCGLGETGRRIVESLRGASPKVKVVAVDLDAGSADALAVEDLGAPTIQGDAKSEAVLRIAGIGRARALVLCTGDDTVNLEVALGAAERAAGRARPLAVVTEMRTGWLFERFVSRGGVGLGSEAVEFRILNLYESAARQLCAMPHLAALATLRPARTDLAVIGFGDMGQAIAAQAIRTTFALPGRRLRLTAFDGRGEAARAEFTALHPGIAAVADVEICKAKVCPGDPDCWEPVRTALGERPVSALIVCLPDDGEALFAASRAREALDALDDLAVPVFVRVAGRRKLADLLARMDAQGAPYERLVPFGGLPDLIGAGLFADGAGEGEAAGDALARACHEAYLDTLAGPPSDKPSRQPWPRLPELYKRSNRLFADHLETKLRAVGLRSGPAAAPRPFAFTQAEREGLASAEHGRWLVERRMAGWRHGAVRDDLRLRHPDLIDWADLPEDVREANRAMVARIPAILGRAAREIRRERLVAYDARAPEAAQAALAGFDPGGQEHLVIRASLADPAARAFALRAAALPNVTLRPCPETGCAGAPAGLSPEEAALLRAASDGCVEADSAPVVPLRAEPRRDAGMV